MLKKFLILAIIITNLFLVYLALQLVKEDKIIKELRQENLKLRAENKLLMRKLEALTVHKVTVTFYTLSKSECDSTPYINALGKQPVIGRDVAVSRDLIYVLGKRVYIEGFGVRKVTDLMNPRFKNRVDILVSSKKQARRLGKIKNVKLIVLY